MENFEYLPFFKTTFKYNNFKISLLEAKEYLNFFLNHPEYLNDYLYDLINYEKLIYIEINFSDNDDINYMVTKLKKIIANNWYKKQQLLHRITR